MKTSTLFSTVFAVVAMAATAYAGDWHQIGQGKADGSKEFGVNRTASAAMVKVTNGSVNVGKVTVVSGGKRNGVGVNRSADKGGKIDISLGGNVNIQSLVVDASGGGSYIIYVN